MQIEGIGAEEQLRILCSIASVAELRGAGIHIGETGAATAAVSA